MAELTCHETPWSDVADAYDFCLFLPVVHVASGDEASVWRAETEHGPVCLKVLRSGRDTSDFIRRATLMEQLRRAGLPFPQLIENASGGVLTTFGSETVGIWAWSRGTVSPIFDRVSARSAARQLAALHLELLRQPDRRFGEDGSPRWLTESAEVAANNCLVLLEAISRRGQLRPVDIRYQSALRERLDDLKRVDDLRQLMPSLTSQLVHHDYTRPNLLFEHRSVVAILDLKGHVGPPIWELGKIAFEPQTVVRSTDWLDVACAATAAYCAEHPEAAASAWSCARAVVLYNMFSFWGPWQRYVEGIRAEQQDMDDYWLNRHATTRRLLANLHLVEDRLDRACISRA